MNCPHGYEISGTCPQCALVEVNVMLHQERERNRSLIEARDLAIRETSAYARRCGELEAQLCAQLVEHPGRKAMLLVLEELRRAKLKHPTFAHSLEQGLVALASEHGELATAILKSDITGPHGVIREAAQVAAVAIRIIEMAQYIVEHNASLKALAEIQGPCTCGWCMGCQRAKEVANV